MEQCKNPWNHVCTCGDIKLYIQVRGENLPICQQCWNQIAEQDEDWGNENRVNMVIAHKF